MTPSTAAATFSVLLAAVGILAPSFAPAQTPATAAPERRPDLFDPSNPRSYAAGLQRDAEMRRRLLAEPAGGEPASLLVKAFSASTGDLGVVPTAAEQAILAKQAVSVVGWLRTLPALARPRDNFPEVSVTVYGRRTPQTLLGIAIAFAAWPRGNIVTDASGRMRSTGETAFTYIRVNTQSIDEHLLNAHWRDALGPMGFARPVSDEFAPLMLFGNGDGVLLPEGVPLYRPVTMERILRAALAALGDVEGNIERSIAQRAREIDRWLEPELAAARARERERNLEVAVRSGNEVAIRRARERLAAGDEPELRSRREALKPFPGQLETLATQEALQRTLDSLDAPALQQPACVRTRNGSAVQHLNVRVVPASAGDCEPVVEINSELMRPSQSVPRIAARYVTVRSRLCVDGGGGRAPAAGRICRKHLEFVSDIDWNRLRQLLDLRLP